MVEERIERGEIRLILMSGARVPAVVVSSNEYNAKFQRVVVVGITQKEGAPDFRVRIDEGETHGYIAIDNPLGVRPLSLGRRVGKVPRAIMDRVDDLLESLFDMGYENDNRQKEINDLKAEVARLNRELEYKKQSIESRAAEVTKYQRLYDKALDQVVDLTLAADLAKRVAEKTVVVEEPEEELVEEYIDITEEEAPVEKSPEKKPVKKVNVNTATIRELVQVGFGKTEAAHIVLWGQSCGGFESLDDLLAVDGVTGKKLRKLRDKLEV